MPRRELEYDSSLMPSFSLAIEIFKIVIESQILSYSCFLTNSLFRIHNSMVGNTKIP